MGMDEVEWVWMSRDGMRCVFNLSINILIYLSMFLSISSSKGLPTKDETSEAIVRCLYYMFYYS